MIRTPTERAGFTLIELLLALVLLGILLGIGIVSLSPLVAQSHLDAATSYLQSALEEAQIRALRTCAPTVYNWSSKKSGWRASNLPDGKRSNFGKCCRKVYRLPLPTGRHSVLVALRSEGP